MKKHIFILFCALLCIPCHAQFIMRKQVTKPQPADSTDISYYSKKKFWRASAMVFGSNMGIWAFDRYVLKEDFAYISGKTISNNFKAGFVWDNDQMGTNMFLHPYHGNLYFNAARSNGYNFWESGGFALGGSFMWEMFMENEKPSANDIIATPIGGMAIGEVLHRTSDMILDDSRRGRNRVFREVSAFIVDPFRGLTRVITGDAWKVRPTSGRQFGIPDVSVQISSGVRVLELRDEILDKGIGSSTEILIEYGDRFEGHNAKPFDYFSFRTSLNIQASQPVLGQLNIIGRLWGTDLIDSKKDYLNLGVYQHFDYYDSDTISSVSNRIPYKFGTPASVGVGLIHKSKRFPDWQFDSYGHINLVLLGASLSDHYLVDKRNYNLGNGFGWKFGANIAYKDKIGISWWYEGFRMYTWKGYPEGYDLDKALQNELNAQGDKSNTSLNTTSIKVDLKISTHLYLTGVASLYRRSTHYDYDSYEDVRSTTGEGRVMLTYKFKQ